MAFPGANGLTKEKIENSHAHHFQFFRHLYPDVSCRPSARIVQEWAREHRAELLENWTKARNLEPLQRIPGADND